MISRRGALLRCVVGRADRGVQRRGDGPGLGPVDDDLDEPQSLLVVADAALGQPGLDVIAMDPPLVRLGVEVSATLDAGPTNLAGRGVARGDARALREVVVIGTRVVGLDVGACAGRVAAVELDAAVHAPRHRPSRLVKDPRNDTRPAQVGGPIYGPS